MDAKFQASFIPKQPLSPERQIPSGQLNLLSVIAIIIFVVVLGLVGAVFIARYILNRDITNLNRELIEAKNSFELQTIEELKRTSVRLTLARGLLERHLAQSKFLEALEQSTYSTVTFNGLEASVLDSGALSITLSGTAREYNSLALQSERFRELPYLTSPVFSNFKLEKGGGISFKFVGVVDPSLISYRKYVATQ